MPFPIAVLISGSGTTLQNLIDRVAAGTLPVRIAQVVSSKRGVPGIERARNAGLVVEIVERKAFPSIEAFSERTFELCRKAGARLVCFGGYLQLLKIPDDYRGRVLNIHPALLPAFGGKGMFGTHVHEAVLASSSKVSGCTVHLVDDQYDHGPIVEQTVSESGRPPRPWPRVVGRNAAVPGDSGLCRRGIAVTSVMTSRARRALSAMSVGGAR